ncbi:BZ3500_MvSof-1268-A1-R1_Chr10-1g02684 [Microbotryum saponariae]|uniref:BZ3500_MvSof-1268-A1-R1_Chr10-1g02684 protein n=1 Tax=Microbotryum saponariae TaxID=289078 RepID=A0A2X0N887_9BASI|nr:BZ3500_MvSof-1268-A1-R1_Chr10-1g02684 [Microbotryum saponariae]SDA06173.1 BZ3501_MvSof-1269-A2-R1_Chr10-1g02285 [Microbotryum saponariae]
MSTTIPTVGFIQDRLHQFPSALVIFLAVLLTLLGVGINNAGARSLLVGTQWGKEPGTETSKPYIGGGVGGIVFGMVTFATLATILLLAVISEKHDPSVGPGMLFALWVCTGLVGGAFGARWRWAARSCCGVLGGCVSTLAPFFSIPQLSSLLDPLRSLSFSYLIIASLHLSSLLARSIFTLLLTLFSLVLCLLPQTVKFLSVLSAFSGAWIHFLGIDLLMKIGYVDLTGLLVAKFGVSASGQVEEEVLVLVWEKASWRACVAGWWLMGLSGAAWQWYWGGEAGGKEKVGDTYLSSLVSTGEAPKALLGTYTPPSESFLTRISHLFTFWKTSSTQSARFTDLPNPRTRNGRRRTSTWDGEELHQDGNEDRLSSRIWTDDEEDELGVQSDEEGQSEELIFGRRGGRKRGGRRVEEHELNSVKDSHRGSNPAKYDTQWSDEEGDYEVDEEDLGLHGGTSRDLRSKPPAYSTSPTRYSLGSGWSGTTLGATGDAADADVAHHGKSGIAPGSGRDPPSSQGAVRGRSDHPSNADRPRKEFFPPNQAESPTRVPLPATPSLRKAIDRIDVAQRQARSETPTTPQKNPFHHPSDESTEYETDLGNGKSSRPVSIKSTSSQASYDAWWAEVIAKSKAK